MLEHKDEEARKLASKLHLQWAERFRKAKKYEAAIDAFGRSMEEDERDDVVRLLGFCETLLNFTRYSDANRISTKCLEIEPSNYQAKWMRVEALYKIGEFGESLVHAYPGYQSHQCRYPFEDAIYRANETIEDCIGRNTSRNVLVELLPWMNKLEEHRNSLIAKLSQEEDEFEGIDEDHTKFRVNDPEFQREYRMKKLDRMLTKRYLASLAVDKFFFDKLSLNLAEHSANKKGSQQLLALVQEHLVRASQMTEVHRIRRPLYTSYFKSQVPSAVVKRKDQEKQLNKYNIIIEVNSILTKLHEARMTKDYSLFFNLVDRAKNKLDLYPNRLFPMKKKCLTQVYKMVGRTYIDPRDVTGIINEDTRLRYLKHHLGIKEATLPRDADLGWVTSPTFISRSSTHRKSTLELFRKRLALTSDPLELTWLYHEFAKIHLQIERLDLARFYAKKSRDFSYDADDNWWTINANHLLVRIEIRQHNRNDAKEAALLAYLGARKIGLDYLEDFYKRIITFVGEMNFDILNDPERDGISTRQKLILNLMSNEKLKKDMENLLDRMNVVPARRRISVMPGCKTIDRQFKMVCKRNTIRVDLAKNQIKEARRAVLRQYAPSRKIPGWMEFHD